MSVYAVVGSSLAKMECEHENGVDHTKKYAYIKKKGQQYIYSYGWLCMRKTGSSQIAIFHDALLFYIFNSKRNNWLLTNINIVLKLPVAYPWFHLGSCIMFALTYNWLQVIG